MNLKLFDFLTLLSVWLNPERSYHDTSGKTDYLRACSDLGINPISYYLKHIQDTEFTMKFHGLGLEGTKALSIPLEVGSGMLNKIM